MRAQVKRFNSPDIFDLYHHTPEEPDCFEFLLEVMVGPENQPGAESIDIVVSTPKWLLKERGEDAVIFGFNRLIVFEYDFEKIAATIKRFCERCTGSTWAEVANKVKRMGYYEFDDYKETPPWLK
jgi:hypothetical protein